MKASEIFLEFAAPTNSGLPDDATVDQLKKALMVPEMVWNAVVMDKDPDRKPGQLPKILIATLIKDIPQNIREITEVTLKFWVERKDLLFSEHHWPLVTEIYKNIKGQMIVRVNVHGPEQLRADLPKEWNEKSDGKIIPISRSVD